MEADGDGRTFQDTVDRGGAPTGGQPGPESEVESLASKGARTDMVDVANALRTGSEVAAAMLSPLPGDKRCSGSGLVIAPPGDRN